MLARRCFSRVRRPGCRSGYAPREVLDSLRRVTANSYSWRVSCVLEYVTILSAAALPSALCLLFRPNTLLVLSTHPSTVPRPAATGSAPLPR